MEEGGEADRDPLVFVHSSQLAPLLQRRQGSLGQVVRAERVLEAGVGGPGIDQEGVPDLAHIAQALHGRGVEGQQRRAVESDVVPQRIADDLELRAAAGDAHAVGPAAATVSGTWLRYCSKFSRNIVASFRAWAS